MKKIAFSSLFILISLIVFSQNKKIESINKLFEEKKYSECILKSEKYIEKDEKFAGPYFYCGFSYLNIEPSGKSNYNNLRSSAKFVLKGLSKSDAINLKDNFKEEFSALHDSLRLNLEKEYTKNDVRARFIAEHLVEIFSDTSEAYNRLVLNITPAPDAEIVKLTKEGKLNATDEKGLNHGPWKKVYANGNTAYEVTFKHGKPVGEYKRYYNSGSVYAILNYDEEGENAEAKFFDESGTVISEGKYIGKNKTGEWKYFQNNVLVRSEEYVDGKMNGFQRVYYASGRIYDEKKWINDIENGLWQKFYETGETHLKAFVKDGLLNGTMVRYYKNGLVEVKGQYINDLPEGNWEYYSENGSKQIIKYKDGKPENYEKIEDENSENYKKTIEMSKRLIDPAEYKNNPDDYYNKSNNK